MRGIIPRAVEQILSQAKVMQAQRWQFTVSASFLEIYNENLRDLLVNLNLQDGSSSSRPSTAANANQKLAIKRDRSQKSYVDGLTQHKIDTENKEVGVQQLEALMAAAARARSVATTKMNAQSSRSHSVFMLHLYGVNDDTGTIVEGSLNLCDLAVSTSIFRKQLSRSSIYWYSRILSEQLPRLDRFLTIPPVIFCSSLSSSQTGFRAPRSQWRRCRCQASEGNSGHQ